MMIVILIISVVAILYVSELSTRTDRLASRVCSLEEHIMRLNKSTSNRKRKG